MTEDLISRQSVLDAIKKLEKYAPTAQYLSAIFDCEDIIKALPSVQPEQLTDTEQRIFLAAMSREEKVCKKVDEEWVSGDEECEISLVHICHEIIRKVKGVLWA